MTARQSTATVLVGGTSVPVLACQLSVDEGRAPFVRAEVTAPYPWWGGVDPLDPRDSPRATISLQQRFNGSIPLDDLTAAWAGLTLDDLTAAWAGLTLDDLSSEWGQPWSAAGILPSQRFAANLGLREATPDHKALTVRYVFASDEALLVDYALVATSTLTPAGTTVKDAVVLALSRAIPGAVLVTSNGTETTDTDARVWQPGVTAWDYLQPLTASVNLRLWCDESRIWHLEHPEDVTTPGLAVLTSATNVTELSDTISRDDGLWYDAVVVVYTWTDVSSVRHVTYDTAGATPATRVLTVRYDRPFPGAGEAAARLRKAQGRGRVVDVTAVNDLTVYPAQEAHISSPTLFDQVGSVTAVQWDVDGTMTVQTRLLVDESPYAWSALAPGIAWADAPVGVSWADTDPWPGE